MKPLHIRALGAAVLVAAATLGSAAPAQASEAPAASVRASASNALPGRPVGMGKLTVFGFDIYNARLWAGSDFAQDAYTRHAFALELAYLRDFNGDLIAQRSLKEMKRIESFSAEQGDRWLAEMVRVFPDVRRGDRLTGVHLPGVGVRFLQNDQVVGEVRDTAFARIFMGIWLSPRTSEPQLRRQLLAEVAN
ncbi:MAG: hypothetical protein RLZ58_569 [Pseudomonadota bacterium]